MAGESENRREEWLLEPPLGPNEFRILVDIGEGAEISPETRAALDSLVEELHASEVEGFAGPVPCPDLADCGHYDCNLGRCQPQARYPCAWNEWCTVTKYR